ncbi:MAG: aldose 1-epimerase [Chitinophagaceae bacterium]
MNTASKFSCNRIQQNGWEEIVLKDEQTGFAATILPSGGAILNKLEINHQGKVFNLVEGFEHAQDWMENKTKGCKSAKLSPFVCRLNHSTYEWEGKTYTCEKYVLNGHAIHGLLFDAVHEVEFCEANNFYAECKLFYRYDGSHPGYPFAYDMNVRYRLESENRLTITTTVHNRSGHTIPISDGWHPYFKIGESIDTATLQINAKQQLEFNADLIPTGNRIKDERWCKGAGLKDVFLDNSFVLLQDDPLPHCTLSDASAGLAIHFYPDESYPILQVYTPPHRRSIAIENLSSAPDAFNNKIGLVSLEADQSHAFKTMIKVDFV